MRKGLGDTTGGNRRITIAILLLPALLAAGRAEALYFTGETLGKEVTAWAVSGFFMTPNPQGYFVNARVFHGLSERLDFEMGVGYSRSTWDKPSDQSKASGTLFFLAGRLRILAVGPFRIGIRGGIQLDPDNIIHMRDGEWPFLQGTLGINLSRHLTLYAATDEAQGATAEHVGGIKNGGMVVPVGVRVRLSKAVALYGETIIQAVASRRADVAPNAAISLEFRR